jgi:hypothetical protein
LLVGLVAGKLFPMRELVYLSLRKLSQFQPERPRGRFLRRITGVGATAPLSLGEISLTLAGPDTQSIPHLDEVLEELDKRRRGVQWYEDEAVQVGDWVQFEARMNYAAVSEPHLTDGAPLLFWEPKLNHSDDGSTGQTSALLLHASPDGLVGNSAGVTGGVAENMSGVSQLIRALERLSGSDEPLGAESRLDNRMWVYVLSNIVRKLDRDYPSFTASWLAGYARITGIISPGENYRGSYMLATPLYVERVSEPDNDEA